MKSFLRWAPICLVMIFLWNGWSLAIEVPSDSGIKAPNFEDLMASFETLRDKYSDRISIEDYGKTEEDRVLRMVILGKKMAKPNVPRDTMLMSGNIHGNEFLGIENRLPGELTEKTKLSGAVADYFKKGGVYIFIPVINPDGYAHRRRTNSRGKDLNRDFEVKAAKHEGFHQVETRLLANKLEDLRKTMNLKYQVTVDYHCCIGALLYPWSFADAPELPEKDLRRFKSLAEIATRLLPIEAGTTPDILGYSGYGTTKDYYYEKYGAAGLTYEGNYRTEAENYPKHVQWWEEMTQMVVNGFDNRQLVQLKKGRAPRPKMSE